MAKEPDPALLLVEIDHEIDQFYATDAKAENVVDRVLALVDDFKTRRDEEQRKRMTCKCGKPMCMHFNANGSWLLCMSCGHRKSRKRHGE